MPASLSQRRTSPSQVPSRRLVTRHPSPFTLRPSPFTLRSGVSLLEVLISMFVLLFGLVGVASMFPVGQYNVSQSAIYDRSAALGQAALSEIETRGMIRSGSWMKGDGTPQIQQGTATNAAFAIDPLGIAANATNPSAGSFPYGDGSAGELPRLTVPDGISNVMSLAVAEHLFVSRDDLALDLPEQRDRPAVQLVSATRREFQGQYSWMFTVVPATDSGGDSYHVSVVVFHKRVLQVGEAGERIVSATVTGGYGGGEVVLQASSADHLTNARAGRWLMLSVDADNDGVVDTLKWYRILATNSSTGTSKSVTLAGPDWIYGANAKATLLDDVVAVYESMMRIEP